MKARTAFAGLGALTSALTVLAASPAAQAGETAAAPSPAEMRALDEDLRDLREEINLWNLVNGLHLSKAQIPAIVRAAKEARDLREAVAGGKHACDMPDADDLAREVRRLEDARDEIARGEDQDGRQTPLPLPAAARNRAPRRDPNAVKARILELETDVAGVLLDSQKEVLRTYKACLVPPADLRNPVRVGQAHDDSHYANALDRVRQVPDARWTDVRGKVVDDLLGAEQAHNGRYGPEKLAARRACLEAVLDEARAQSPTDYALRRDALAAKIKPEDVVEKLTVTLDQLREQANQPGKIAAFLLHPKVVPILERRLHDLATAKRDPVNLDKVDPAENCQDGNCGKK